MKKLFFLLLSLVGVQTFAQFKSKEPFAHTFSIVARDPVTGEIAVGVQSHWFSVGTSVSWAEAGVGAVATQSFTNKSFGIRGLKLLKEGKTAQQALDILLSDDPGIDVRQVAIVDNKGNVAVHTGKGCVQFAGDIKGEQYSVQSNMMLTDKVPTAMSKAFEASKGKPLAQRVMSALNAAQAVGGDIRGKQSAAILVVPAKSNNEPWNERTVDLRVDDAQEPLLELERLLKVHEAYQFMNEGDLAVEKNDMPKAMSLYGAAMKMFPDNLEMQYWTAVTLANNKEVSKALPMFKKIFSQNTDWKEMTKRLPAVKLLTVTDEEMKLILAQ
ncbi:DUF1028 domain-containing protein [Pedobacter cryophilus]|uniref:DUF1028 domain-containing protein n=1 Tax=Pedobacter cryophilus TaxID=2571271 RepID=A0A4V5NY10_9SPHI|nr:DUF1028 domain-containing protein [Pedobacter cryophilus]TKC00701.1 DUF1028 domain-containing protein [Pedobacter cryophilus]